MTVCGVVIANTSVALRLANLADYSGRNRFAACAGSARYAGGPVGNRPMGLVGEKDFRGKPGTSNGSPGETMHGKQSVTREELLVTAGLVLSTLLLVILV